MADDAASVEYIGIAIGIADALLLHAEIMERTGSEPQPPRSLDGLSSALNRAPTAAHYGGADLIGQAARLATGVSRAQAFLKGNKRTAFVVATVFLELNAYTFAGDPLEFAQKLDALADPSLSDDEADERFESWLRDRVSSLADR